MKPGSNAGDATTSLSVLKGEVQRFCEARDWDQFHGPKDLAIGVVTEAVELLEVFRFLDERQADELLNAASGRESVGAELADVLIFLLRFAQRFDFDLTEALLAKLAENEQRYPVDEARGSNRKAT